MKKALSLILICLFLTACSNVSQFVDLKIKDVEVRAELAVNFKEKIQGLSGRENLENNQGMLFLYEQAGQYSFWMKDMNFSLDIIYINLIETVKFLEYKLNGSKIKIKEKKNILMVTCLTQNYIIGLDLNIQKKKIINKYINKKQFLDKMCIYYSIYEKGIRL